MYQGKFKNQPGKHRRLRWRREFVLVCSVLVLFIGMVGSTLAYLTTKTDPVKNTFTPSSIDVTVPENFTDKETKKDVKVKNEGDIPVYARATYVAYWVSDDGSVLPEVPVLNKTMGTDWTYREDDGYWYYNKILAAKATSTNFIVSMTANKIEGRHLVVDVIAETVQASPDQAVIDVWGFKPSAN